MAGYIGSVPVPQSTQTRDNFTATSGQTTFSTSGYTPNYLDVYLNGVHLDPSDYTATNGTDVVLGTGATAGDIVSVVAFSTFETVDQAFSGDFSVDGSTFVVDSTNNRVGIGTSSPVGTLNLASTGEAYIRIDDLDTSNTYATYGMNNGVASSVSRNNTSDGVFNWYGYDGSSFKERMRIDSSGRVTMPHQPSFNAYLPAVTTHGNTVTFGATRSNVGNHFNTSTGKFTAPVAGTYSFNFAILHRVDATYYYHRITFMINGTSNTRYGDTLMSQVSGMVYSSACMGTSIYLNANDTVGLYVEGSETYGATYGSFSGHLVG